MFKQLISFTLFMLFLTGVHQSVLAQSTKQFSSSEDVAIAFYKTAKIIPNFDRWITGQAPYNETAWALREKVMQAEKQRLKNAYLSFDPKKDQLTIRTKVTLKTQQTAIEDQKIHHLKIDFSKVPDAFYFPYNFLDMNIAVTPKNLKKTLNPEISAELYNFLQKELKEKNNNLMIIRLRPEKADTSQPYKINQLQQWVMTASISSIEIWSKDGRILWDYSAPWFVAPEIEQIENLYDQNYVFTDGTEQKLIPRE